jgi:ribosomal protein L6P/L9E
VTKGYKYKMRYVYAHFPINVNIEKNNETDLYELEIRYVSPCSSNTTSARNSNTDKHRIETSWARRLSATSQ